MLSLCMHAYAVGYSLWPVTPFPSSRPTSLWQCNGHSIWTFTLLFWGICENKGIANLDFSRSPPFVVVVYSTSLESRRQELVARVHIFASFLSLFSHSAPTDLQHTILGVTMVNVSLCPSEKPLHLVWKWLVVLDEVSVLRFSNNPQYRFNWKWTYLK